MKEPIWLKRLYIEAFHEDQLRINGGLDEERAPAALDAALARPLYLFQYKKADLCALAACYAHGITKCHAFNDGNKRAAFAATVVFLDMNGLELTLTEPEATKAMEDLTCSKITQDKFAELLCLHTHKTSSLRD